MTMGKNMERKKIDFIIKAFDKFLDKVGRDLKYKLYLHTDIESATGGTDLYQLVLDLNIQNHILLSHSFIQGITMSTEDLYKRYSVCDCYITLSSGEGFNYGTCEAMANKLPVVYIDYGGHAEYLKDIGLPVNVKTTYSASNAQMEWAIADIDHAAKQMARAVSDPKWRERASINGYKYAEENFDWEIVYSKFKKALIDGYSKFKRPGIFEFSLKRVV
jgi:glycosyltransferase involved in cell wall biosynthesis